MSSEVVMKTDNGEVTKAFPLDHAERILAYQDKNKSSINSFWILDDPKFKFENGRIIRQPSKRASKKASKSEKDS
jgi:hypothetical protein